MLRKALSYQSRPDYDKKAAFHCSSRYVTADSPERLARAEVTSPLASRRRRLASQSNGLRSPLPAQASTVITGAGACRDFPDSRSGCSKLNCTSLSRNVVDKAPCWAPKEPPILVLMSPNQGRVLSREYGKQPGQVLNATDYRKQGLERHLSMGAAASARQGKAW